MSANPDTADQSGSGVPPLNAADRKRRDAAATLGHASQITPTPDRTADFADDADMKTKSVPSDLSAKSAPSAVNSPAPTGRNKPAQGNAP